jgi:DNA phosphorothioation system restriction enzyme
MPFHDLNLPLSVKTTSGDPIRDFFDPVLSQAMTYDVAVGYFSPLWIRDAAHGLAKFAINGGRARWIISPELKAEDFELLRGREGNGCSPDVITNVIEESFLDLFERLEKAPRESLGWLIADQIIEFRIGIPDNKLSGILHSKMGHLRDAEGHEIAFSGSYNLTHGAQTNWEKIDIYCDWSSPNDHQRVQDTKFDFNEMWSGNDPNLSIYKPTDKALEPFVRAAKTSVRPYKLKIDNSTSIRIPPSFLTDGKMRPYQEEAIRNWFANNGCGVFNMATGSGKTATALAAATRFANYSEKEGSSLTFVVTVPFKHLADQWIEEAETFGFKPIRCYDSVAKWMPLAQAAARRLSTGEENIAMLVVVNATFTNKPFQQYLEHLPGNLCIIADEMHNLGAPHLVKALPQKSNFRLGLSATPVRHGDEQGTKSLEEYFGDEVICFSLKEAIAEGFLCRYRYFPVPVALTEIEMDEYREISKKIAKIFHFGEKNGDGPSDPVKNLLIRRARLIAGAENKIGELLSLLKDRKDSSYNLIYCGDASDGDERHVDKVLRLVGANTKMKANSFTAKESPAKRKELLQQFGTGELQALVAIRCLDEGVDVPRTETAYILASSTNPRQFIQRRGRVLRRAPGKSTATIYDFIALPNIEEIRQSDPQSFNIERRLVKRELDRINEFAKLAINSGESLRRLRDIKKKLNLLDG